MFLQDPTKTYILRGITQALWQFICQKCWYLENMCVIAPTSTYLNICIGIGISFVLLDIPSLPRVSQILMLQVEFWPKL